MSFLNPLALLGLFALSIPIIVHLFNFRRTKKIYFSSTQFLEQVAEESTSKLRIKHWLILFSRLLFITFLVLAFAQPFIPAQNQRQASKNVFVYLDNSLSMGNEVANDIRAFDESISIVSSLLDIYPPETKYILLTADFAPSGNTLKSRNEVDDLLTELNFTGNSRSFEEVISKFKSLEQRQISGEWYFISDFQKSTFGEFDDVFIDSTQQLNLVPIGFDSERNLFVDSLYLRNPFDQESSNVEVVAIIQNSGNEDVIEAGIKVFLNNTQSSSSVVSVPAKGKVEIDFDLGASKESASRGRISIEEYPVTFDNEFFFSVNNQKKIKVFEIKGSSQGNFVGGVYGNSSLFDFVSNDEGNINYSELNTADFIILNGVDNISISLSSSIANVLDDGKTLLVIPSYNPEISSYQSLLGNSYQLSDTLFASEILAPDFNNPFFENVFEDKDANIAMFRATPIVDWGSDRTAILRYSNGNPFLSKISLRRKIFALSSPLNETFNGFQNHALFVPVMYKMAFSSLTIEDPLYYTLNSRSIPIRLDTVSEANSVFKLVSESYELIPDQRVNGNQLLITIPPELIEPGFYSVSNNQLNDEKLIAFNPGKVESFLEQIARNDLESIANQNENIILLNVDDSRQFASEFRGTFEGVPLWKYALVISLLFLLVEILIIRFYK